MRHRPECLYVDMPRALWVATVNFDPKGAEFDPLADLGLPKLRRKALQDDQLLRVLYSVTALALIYGEDHERKQTKCLEPGKKFICFKPEACFIGVII